VNGTDERILSADVENGYTRVANLILEALPLVRMNSTQYGICLFIWRRTFGWHRDHDAISLGEFADACGTNKTYISKLLQDLLQKNIIRRVECRRGKTPVYAFVTNLAAWDSGCIDLAWLFGNQQRGLYKCSPEGYLALAEGGGEGTPGANGDQGGSSVAIREGLSVPARVGLPDRVTPERVPGPEAPGLAASLKKGLKKDKERRIYAPDSIELELSQLLLMKIKEHLPDYKSPDLQKWAQIMDRMIRLDGREPDEVREVILYAQGDPFWCSNIMSVNSLRKYYDRLNLKRQHCLPAGNNLGTVPKLFKLKYACKDGRTRDCQVSIRAGQGRRKEAELDDSDEYDYYFK